MRPRPLVSDLLVFAVSCLPLVSAACGSQPKPEPASSPAAAAPSPARPAARKDILATETKLYSQKDEELIIRDFFQDRQGGFFLDVGCAWPIKNNNTYYLESKLGWSGIGIDALPEYAQPWSRKRRNSRFFNLLVTDHGGTTESFYRSELAGISATKPMKGPAGKDVKYEEIRIPTSTLNAVLEKSGVSKVDLLSMDIEGAEPLALAGFDIERYRPDLACIELHASTRDKVIAYFEKHGYERIERYLKRDPVNYYFARKGEAR
jgi:FkbM family methyltransferase